MLANPILTATVFLSPPLGTAGGDSIDGTVVYLGLFAAQMGSELWALVQNQPYHFSAGGVYYRQAQRDVGLRADKHVTFPSLPGKVSFAASAEQHTQARAHIHTHTHMCTHKHMHVTFPSLPGKVSFAVSAEQHTQARAHIHTHTHMCTHKHMHVTFPSLPGKVSFAVSAEQHT